MRRLQKTARWGKRSLGPCINLIMGSSRMFALMFRSRNNNVPSRRVSSAGNHRRGPHPVRRRLVARSVGFALRLFVDFACPGSTDHTIHPLRSRPDAFALTYCLSESLAAESDVAVVPLVRWAGFEPDSPLARSVTVVADMPAHSGYAASGCSGLPDCPAQWLRIGPPVQSRQALFPWIVAALIAGFAGSKRKSTAC